MIELNKLTKRYGEIIALHETTATIDGKIIGLLGPNGAGKSTLLKCLLGLIPFEGSARVLGLAAGTHGTEIRDRVGYMPEHESFLPGMSAVELCAYAAELSGLPRVEAMQRAHAALYYAGLEDKRYQPVDTYSTGQRQRVKLAQALVHDPELLFLDEPTNGLEPKAREDMLQLVRELPKRRGCAIVLSTHLLPDVERVCDHAVIMDKGRVRFTGTLEELRAREAAVVHELAIEVRGDAAKLAEALGVAGATCVVISPIALHADLDTKPGDADAATRIFATARACGVQIRGIAARRETVEAAVLRVLAGP